jgi:hypothetical protein
MRRHLGVLHPRYLTPWPVNISWALMSNRRSCFAGAETGYIYASLSAARAQDIDAQFIRVFAGEGSSTDIEELARRYDCRVIVVSASDGAWTRDPFAASPLPACRGEGRGMENLSGGIVAIFSRFVPLD